MKSALLLLPSLGTLMCVTAAALKMPKWVVFGLTTGIAALALSISFPATLIVFSWTLALLGLFALLLGLRLSHAIAHIMTCLGIAAIHGLFFLVGPWVDDRVNHETAWEELEPTVRVLLGSNPYVLLCHQDGRDPLRGPVSYRMSNLADFQIHYPHWTSSVWAYSGTALLTGAIALFLRKRRAG